MSGLAGIWNLDGAPVSAEILAAMSARLSHRGRDAENLLIREQVGFAHQSTYVTPESMQEVQPAIHPAGAMLLWDGRLDNREDLLNVLSSHSGLETRAPDPVFVLSAFTRYGHEFPTHLNGDFALALFDPRSQTLYLARDVSGCRTLHYCWAGNRFLFASEIKALLAHPDVRTAPNDYRIAEWIYRIPDYSEPTATFFKNIFTIPPGHCLKIDRGGSSTLTKFWDFDPSTQLRLRRYEDYVDAYRDCFQRAVERRLRTAFPAAIFVSGGLDSSSIYSMAHHSATLGSVKAPSLIGMAFAGSHPTADERSYQKVMKEAYSSPWFTMPCDSSGAAADGIDKPTWHTEGPFLQAEMWFQSAQVALRHGSRVILSGFFGDHVLLNPQYILDLLYSGRLIAAYQHSKRFMKWWEAYSTRQGVLDLLTNLKGYVIPERARPMYHRVKARFKRLDPQIERFPWYSDRIASHGHALNHSRQLMKIPPMSAHARILYAQAWSRIHTLRSELDTRADARHPVETNYPFRDRDLIQLLMSIPGEVIYRSGSRGIHRDAMKGILPEEVRTRRSKTSYNHPVSKGALADLDHFQSRIETGVAAQMGYLVRQPALRAELEGLRACLKTGHSATWPTATFELLALEGWLASFFGGVDL